MIKKIVLLVGPWVTHVTLLKKKAPLILRIQRKENNESEFTQPFLCCLLKSEF